MAKNSFKRLKGKSALVSGANSGIGEAIARAFAYEGANVGLNYVQDEQKAKSIVREIRKKRGKAIAIFADVSKEEDVQNMFKQVLKEFGKLDILVSNAGIQRDSPFVQMSLKNWQKVLDVNLTGSFLCARESARIFLKKGKKKGKPTSLGNIIFISSVHEVIPWAGHANYTASKGGLMMLMKTIAQELAPYGIRVNSIAPGAIKTPINRAAWSTPQAERKLLQLIPYGRIGQPEDVAQVAVWLASDESEYITGTTIYVDGGATLYPGFSTAG